MASYLLDLWPVLCRHLVVVLGLLALIVLGWCSSSEPPETLVPALIFWGMVLGWIGLRRVMPWLPLVRRTRRFRTASSGRVVLRYAAELPAEAAPGEVLELAERTLAELEAKFGRLTPLLFRRRVHVYLFPACRPIQEIFGKQVGGTALSDLHAVVVPYRDLWLDEIVRHELAHLFSLRWNPSARPLLGEGLSTWMQGTQQGQAIDAAAADFALLRRDGYNLRPLLDEAAFFAAANRWACYTLAGSFTGFLLRRFGWAAYKRLYCDRSCERGFATPFKMHFGLSFKEAERQWQEELQERYVGPMRPWLLRR